VRCILESAPGDGLSFAAAHSVPGEPTLPTSPSQPEPAPQPQTESAVGASPYDRMQAEVKALQQQAQSTQASLKKLQAQEPVDPVAAIVSGVPDVPVMGGAGLVVASVLAVALALVWWYLWRRPPNQPVDAGHTKISELTEDSAYGQAQQPTKPAEQTRKAQPVQESPQPAPTPVPASPFAKPEPTMGFDSEAAATEVMRVRKSLAEKREARFLLREEEEEEPVVDDVAVEAPADAQPAPPDPWSMPEEGSYREAAPAFDIDIHFTLPERPPVPEPLQEPEPAFEPEPAADRQPVSTELDINIDEAEDAPFAAIAAEPDPVFSAAVAPDYATTLALAQVSEELEQLNEARDLAYEVLQSDDPALQTEARALLERLSEVESEMGPESVRWDDLR